MRSGQDGVATSLPAGSIGISVFNKPLARMRVPVYGLPINRDWSRRVSLQCRSPPSSISGDVSSLRSADRTSTGEPVDSSIDYTAPRTPGPAVPLDFVCQLPRHIGFTPP